MQHMFAINLCAALVLGAALHLYLYTYSGKHMRMKFDLRPIEKSPRVTFGNQVRDNLFCALVWVVPIWSVWMILYS